jgi:hypothetical protein
VASTDATIYRARGPANESAEHGGALRPYYVPPASLLSLTIDMNILLSKDYIEVSAFGLHTRCIHQGGESEKHGKVDRAF